MPLINATNALLKYLTFYNIFNTLYKGFRLHEKDNLATAISIDINIDYLAVAYIGFLEMPIS